MLPGLAKGARARACCVMSAQEAVPWGSPSEMVDHRSSYNGIRLCHGHMQGACGSGDERFRPGEQGDGWGECGLAVQLVAYGRCRRGMVDKDTRRR